MSALFEAVVETSSNEVDGDKSPAVQQGPMKSILCVEDNAEIQILVQAALDQHQVTPATQIAEARDLLAQQTFDLVILDVELPDGDGLKFLAELGDNTTKTPVFMLTGKSETANKVIAFSLGAEDFVAKPFDVLELRARVNAKLKRLERSHDERSLLKIKDLSIDVAKQRVFLNGSTSIALTSLEFRLLMTLAKAPDRVFSREQLLDKVWGSDVSITDRTVDTHIGHLRKKIAASKVKIETVVNEGYRLV